MFRVVSRGSVAERDPLRSRVPRVHTMHHFMLPKLRLVFSQRTCPIHFFRAKTHVPGGYARFRCRKYPLRSLVPGVHTMYHFVLPKLRLVFWQRTCPIHSFRAKKHVPGGFARFRCRKVPVAKSGAGGAYNAPLCASKVASCFFATNMPNPLL